MIHTSPELHEDKNQCKTNFFAHFFCSGRDFFKSPRNLHKIVWDIQVTKTIGFFNCCSFEGVGIKPHCKAPSRWFIALEQMVPVPEKKYEHILEIFIECILRIIYQSFLKYKVFQHTLLFKSLYMSNCNSCLLKNPLLCIYGYTLSCILLFSVYESLSFESVNFLWKEGGRQTGGHACVSELILI